MILDTWDTVMCKHNETESNCLLARLESELVQTQPIVHFALNISQREKDRLGLELREWRTGCVWTKTHVELGYDP